MTTHQKFKKSFINTPPQIIFDTARELFEQAKSRYPKHLMLFAAPRSSVALFSDAKTLSPILKLPTIYVPHEPPMFPALVIPTPTHHEFMRQLARILNAGYPVASYDPCERRYQE